MARIAIALLAGLSLVVALLTPVEAAMRGGGGGARGAASSGGMHHGSGGGSWHGHGGGSWHGHGGGHFHGHGCCFGGFYAFPYYYPYYPYPYYAYSYPYPYPAYTYSAPAYTDPLVMQPAPPAGASQSLTPNVQREVVYPNGKYVLYGDGVNQAWQWVWVPAPPPPPAAPQQ